jgi:hypothetical protein
VEAGFPGAKVPANPAHNTGERNFERHADAAKSSAKFARAPGSNEELGQSKTLAGSAHQVDHDGNIRDMQG